MSPSAQAHPDPAAEVQLRAGLAAYARADFDAALTALAGAAAHARQGGACTVEVQALIEMGKVHRDLGAPTPALECLGRALGLARLHGDLAGEGDALNQRAGVHHLGGEYARALDDLGEALRVARLLNDPRRAANGLINTGILCTKLGDYPRALKALTEAHALAGDPLGDAGLKAQVQINLGLLYEEMGDDARALRSHQDAMQTLAGHGLLVLESITTVNLGNAHQRLGQLDAAADHFARAIVLALETGHAKVEIAALDGLGQVHARRGAVEDAITLHHVALTRARDTGDAESEMDALLNLGRDHLDAGTPENAMAFLTSALECAEQSGRRRTIAAAHDLLAETLERLGDPAAALAHHRAYHRVEKLLFNEAGEHKTRQLTIQFDLERAQHEAEVYRLGTELERDARERAEATVRERTWELERGRDIIERQRAELQEQVQTLHGLLGQNEALRQRLMLAARRTTTLNERYLRRLSAELHDGPAQELGFALMKLGDLSDASDPGRVPEADVIQAAVQRAVTEMRAIAGGLCLPELEALTLPQTLERAVQAHRRRTRRDVTVTVTPGADSEHVPLPTKITVYRVVQESLNNAFKHAGAQTQSVHLTVGPDGLLVEIIDDGTGFTASPALHEPGPDDDDPRGGGLGLLGMRERVESLGGHFHIHSCPGHGTRVHVRLPLPHPPTPEAPTLPAPGTAP